MAQITNQYSIPSTVKIYLIKESNGNIAIAHYDDHTTFEHVYCAKCAICSKTFEARIDPRQQAAWEDWLKPFADFAFDHRHEKVTMIKKPGVFTEPNQEVVKIKPGQVVQINGKAFDVVADLGESSFTTVTYTQPEIPLTVRTEVKVQEFVSGRKFRDVE